MKTTNLKLFERDKKHIFQTRKSVKSVGVAAAVELAVVDFTYVSTLSQQFVIVTVRVQPTQ